MNFLLQILPYLIFLTISSLGNAEEGFLEETSNAKNTTVQEISYQGLLESAVGLLFGEYTQKLLFDENSPVQYALSYDYSPLISSVTTIVAFVTSENSPGYILATYDYGSLLRRLTPQFVHTLASRYTSGRASAFLISASGLIVASSIFSVIFWLLYFLYITAVSGYTDFPRLNSGRALDFDENEVLNNMTNGVMKAVNGYKMLRKINKNSQDENMDLVVDWLGQLTTGAAPNTHL